MVVIKTGLYHLRPVFCFFIKNIDAINIARLKRIIKLAEKKIIIKKNGFVME
ncbi:MAG: hypothetical protein RBR08_01560 [Desulforegulaceae bacterium]|nr:hypothetical protein [Desulforegulaceae bacterium]